MKELCLVCCRRSGSLMKRTYVLCEDLQMISSHLRVKAYRKTHTRCQSMPRDFLESEGNRRLRTRKQLEPVMMLLFSALWCSFRGYEVLPNHIPGIIMSQKLLCVELARSIRFRRLWLCVHWLRTVD